MSRRPSWDVIAVVAAGGALGAAARYGVTLAWPSPWAILVVNVVGSIAIGALVELLGGLSAPHRLARPFLGTGVLGGFTTFSTYAVDALELPVTYLAGTLVGALAAVWLGMLGVRLLRRPR
jgi:fluoride exporter